MVKKIILMLVIFSLIIFSGCEDKNKIEDEDEIKDSKIAQLESQIEQLNTKITELEGEIN